MPQTHAVSGNDADQPKSKRQKLTNSQLERKRELDREAQRTIRERTKNHIAHLEALVQQLQGDQGSQVQRLVAQLNESRAEVNRLRDALNNITKISASVLGANQITTDSSQQPYVKQESSPVPPLEPQRRRKRPNKSSPIPPSHTDSEHEHEHEHVHQYEPGHENPREHEAEFVTSGVSHRREESGFHMPSFSKDYHRQDDMYSCNHRSHNTAPPKAASEGHGHIIEDQHTMHDIPTGIKIDNSQLSVSQMAASIVANHQLEGRYWYLAGVLLTEILKKQQQGGFVHFADDEDIAIRAVFEGWSSVLERYPLDRGWQWLKELDETIYFYHFGPAERLMNLRNCRYQFLHQCYPDAGWNKHLPNFYRFRHPSQHELGFDPLVEHFPWPGFRKQLLYSPRKFATNKFMEALRTNLRFVWNNDSQALYHRDPLSGQYLYSDLFISHIKDIKCYAVRPSFFDDFPELGQEIPWSRGDEPTPLSMISHRFSVGSNSTSSTNRPSPVMDEDLDEEGYSRHKNVDLNYSNMQVWHSGTCSPTLPGFVRELSGD